MAYDLVNDFVAFPIIVFVVAVILLIFFIVLSPILNAVLGFLFVLKYPYPLCEDVNFLVLRWYIWR